MSDYKEIIKELNIEFNECDKLIGRKIHLNLSDAPHKKYEILAEDCCGEMVGIMQTISCAADAIEQLAKERDAAVAEIHWLIVSWFTTGKINACKICCNYNDGNHNNECKNCHTLCPYSNFSWRGVQE
ncbi:MAG: hypothetical protein KBT06_08635 [Prevotellaceae bacterium]|nr:hypothetical protein [Candidatus Colivivens equi]